MTMGSRLIEKERPLAFYVRYRLTMLQYLFYFVLHKLQAR